MVRKTNRSRLSGVVDSSGRKSGSKILECGWDHGLYTLFYLSYIVPFYFIHNDFIFNILHYTRNTKKDGYFHVMVSDSSACGISVDVCVFV